MDKGTTMAVGGGATTVTAAKLETAKSILDVPLFYTDILGPVAEVSTRDILVPMGFIVAAIGIAIKLVEMTRKKPV